MKPSKLKSLFEAAARDSAPEPGFAFSHDVVSALRRDAKQHERQSVAGELANLFGRLAWACVIIIGVCMAAEYCLVRQDAGLTATIEQARQQWFFASN